MNITSLKAKLELQLIEHLQHLPFDRFTRSTATKGSKELQEAFIRLTEKGVIISTGNSIGFGWKTMLYTLDKREAQHQRAELIKAS